MALFENQNSYLIRSANKEPDFSTVYDDLFDQYVDTDHFNFGGSPLERRSSDDLSSNAHDLLGSSNDSNPADSSPHTSWDASQAASDEFWENTLRCFQQKVAQQAYIQSPIASPLASPDLVPQNSYFALPADAYEVQPMPIPLRVPHSGSPHSQQNNNRNSWPRPAPPTASSAYDTAEYPPDSNPWGNPWGDSGGDEGSRAAARAADLDVEADVPGFSSLIPTELAGMGLMINCDPSSMHSLHDGSNAANNALVESIYGNLANMTLLHQHGRWQQHIPHIPTSRGLQLTANPAPAAPPTRLDVVSHALSHIHSPLSPISQSLPSRLRSPAGEVEHAR
ncbi:hypothetical protein H2203_004750 [Taxawa tesnikishii (nom. ined.)]|nr:hypothetical protein H2203_004750 [Dothideales sp. JES 119]